MGKFLYNLALILGAIIISLLLIAEVVGPSNLLIGGSLIYYAERILPNKIEKLSLHRKEKALIRDALRIIINTIALIIIMATPF